MRHGRSDYNRIQDPAANEDLLAVYQEASIALSHEGTDTQVPEIEIRDILNRLVMELDDPFGAIIEQPPTNPIGRDEPVFLLRASDSVAPMLVREYARLCRQRGSSWLVAESIIEVAKSMEEWANAHGAKLPDLPRETVTAGATSPSTQDEPTDVK